MKCTSNNILVKIEKRIDNTHTFANGIEIEINTAYNEGKMVNQEAEVVAVGVSIKDISVGDVVFVHHLVPTDINRIQDDIFKCISDNCFAYKKGDTIQARNGFVICTPNKNKHIEENKGILLKSEKEFNNKCQIAFTSIEGLENGLENNDWIYVNNPLGTQSFFYSFKIGKSEYFRVPISQILYKINNQ